MKLGDLVAKLGYDAHNSGRGLGDNPYDGGRHPTEWRLWREGWFKAEQETFRR